MSFPELASAAVQVAIASKLLRANRKARNRLIPFANRNLGRAEQQFERQFDLRDFDEEVYDRIREIPRYQQCMEEVERGYRTGQMVGANLVKSGVFAFSRYNCGGREEHINQSLAAGMVLSGEVASNAGNFEDTLEVAYEQLRWTALSTSSRFAAPSTGRAFSDTATSLIRQAELFGTAAENSVASAVKSGASLFLKATNKGDTKTIKSDETTTNTGATQATVGGPL